MPDYALHESEFQLEKVNWNEELILSKQMHWPESSSSFLEIRWIQDDRHDINAIRIKIEILILVELHNYE